MTPRLARCALAALLVAASFAAYRPALDAGFVAFDDDAYVYDNPQVAAGLGRDGVYWAFSGAHASNWHPLTWLSHMADVELFGSAPKGHHFTNVALHAANAVLLFLLLASLTGAPLPSFFAAGVFALHPANVESVAWIAQRKTTLSTLFALLAVAGYVRWVRRRAPGAYAASLLCFGLSLASKQTFVTLPVLLLLLDYWPLRRDLELERALRAGHGRWWPLLREKVPYGVLAAAASLVTLHVQADAMPSIEAYPLSERLGNAPIAYVRYLGMLLWPARLAVFYPQLPGDVTAPKLLACLALLAAVTGLVWRLRRWRFLLVGWLWLLVALVPMIGVVQVGAQALADRYAYTAFWGPIVALVFGAAAVLRSRPRATLLPAVAGVAGLLVLATLGFLASRQARSWHDTVTLFEDAVADTRDNWLAHRTLAAEYFGRGDYGKALEHCEKGLALGRDLGTFLGTCGLTLYETGRPGLALEKLEEAIRIAPDNPIGFMNLGWIHAERGEHERAAELLAEAARKLPPAAPRYAYRTVYANWGRALASLGRAEEAREKYERALARDPDVAFVLRDAAQLDLEGDPPRAARRLERAVALDPGDAKARYLLASAYAFGGDLDAAAATLVALADLTPRASRAALQLAETLARLGRAQDAARLLERTRAAAGRSPSEGARAAVAAIDTRLAPEESAE
jgi:tetratricopeptide (TPR) repeat protein